MITKSFDVDVVIPFWWGDVKYAAEAVVSILNQIGITPYIHIVADGAKDNEVYQCLKQLPEAKNVKKYLSQDTLGPSVLVNSIVKHHCLTDYVAIQDADDIAFNFRLKKQYEVIGPDTEAVHSSAAMIQFPAENYTGRRHKEQPAIYCLNQTYGNMPRGKFINSTRMIRKDTFIELNGFPDMMVSGDLVFDNNLIYLEYKSICFDEPLAYRRVHDTSITHIPHYLRENTGGRNAIAQQMNYLNMIRTDPTLETARMIGKLDIAPELEIFR